MGSVVRIFIIASIGLAVASAPRQALAVTFSTECVSSYSACGNPNIPNACTNTENFRSKMSGYGYTATSNQYEGAGVYDSDQVESDIISGGHDNLYTDVTGTNLEYFSMHGTCGNYPHGVGSCTSDSNCQTYVTHPPSGWASGLTWGCDTISGTCSGWTSQGVGGNYDRYTITCSPQDTFGHGADITNQIYFGE